MSIAQTSQEAFAKVRPHLTLMQSRVLEFLRKQDPKKSFTNKQIAALIGWEINKVTPRVGELLAQGVLEDCGRRTCQIGGNNARHVRVMRAQSSLFDQNTTADSSVCGVL